MAITAARTPPPYDSCTGAPAPDVLVGDGVLPPADVAEVASLMSELACEPTEEASLMSELANEVADPSADESSPATLLVRDATTDEALADAPRLVVRVRVGEGEGDAAADDAAAAADDEAAADASEATEAADRLDEEAAAADDEASLHGCSGSLGKEKLHCGAWQLRGCQSGLCGPGRGAGRGETNAITAARHGVEHSPSPDRLLQPSQLFWAATAAARLRTTTAAVFIWVSVWEELKCWIDGMCAVGVRCRSRIGENGRADWLGGHPPVYIPQRTVQPAGRTGFPVGQAWLS